MQLQRRLGLELSKILSSGKFNSGLRGSLAILKRL